MGIIIAAVVFVYVAISLLIIRFIPTSKAKIFATGLFVLIPFGDHWVGLAYHKYLCVRDAGQIIFKKVDRVEGFLIDGMPDAGFLYKGYRFIEGHKGSRESTHNILRYQLDPTNGEIIERETSENIARYRFDLIVEHVKHGLFGYFDYLYQESVISDIQENTILGKQARISYRGGWLSKVVFDGGGGLCFGDSENVVAFVMSVLRPIGIETEKVTH